MTTIAGAVEPTRIACTSFCRSSTGCATPSGGPRFALSYA